MRRLLVGPIIAFGLVWPLAAVADQTDPRLDNLFEILRTSDSPRDVKAAENLIWSIWIHHEDAANERLMQRGIKAMQDGRLSDALAIYDDLVERAPDYAEAWNKRATVQFLLGNLAESAADVAETLKLEPRHFGALSGLGQIEMMRGDRESALDAFEAAARVHPHLSSRSLIEALRESLRGRDRGRDI